MSLANLFAREAGKVVLAAHLVTLREGEIRYCAGNEQALVLNIQAQFPSALFGISRDKGLSNASHC